MRKPKKLTALLLALTLLFACAACGSGNSTTDSGKTISGTLPEIIDRLYDTVDVDDEQRDFLKNSVGTVEIPKDQSAYYFGVENLDFEEAVASEPLINAIAFSVCLMRVKDGTDIDELKAEIRRSANRKSVGGQPAAYVALPSWAQYPQKTPHHLKPSPSKKQNLTKTPKIAMMNINAA